MADVSIDPVQGGILAVFLGFVVKFLFMMRADQKEKNVEKDTKILELMKAQVDSAERYTAAMEKVGEHLARLEDRTRWMLREKRPSDPPDDWTPVHGVPTYPVERGTSGKMREVARPPGKYDKDR